MEKIFYLMRHWIDDSMILLAVLYGASKLYAALFNIAPKNEMSTKEILSSVKTQTGFGLFLVPFTAGFAFIYNLLYNIIWFSSELINWVVKGCMWIYQEIIKAGLFLILRVLWHYLVLWPWKLLNLAFSNIKSSLNKKDYIYAVKGLTIALAVAFLGRFVNQHFGCGIWAEVVFAVISIFPLGWAIGNIAHGNENNEENKNLTIRYFKHAGLLIALLVLFVLAQVALVKVGAETSFAYALSALFIGPNLVSSAFIIFNSLLLIFIVSALPSFSRTFDGKWNELYKAFGMHLYQKGLRYLLAMPMMVVPFAALIVVPYYIGGGVSSTSLMVTTDQYGRKLTALTQELEKSNIASYDAWYDTEAVTADSLKKLMDADKSSLKLKAEYARVNSNRNYMYDIYSTYYNQVANAPLNVALSLFQKYMDENGNRVPVNAYPKSDDDTNAFASDLAMSRAAVAEANQSVNNDAPMSSNNMDTPTTDTMAASESVVVDSSVIGSTATAQTGQVSESQPANSGESASNPQLERAKAIEAHISSMQNQLKSMQSSMSLAGMLGHFIAGLWMCLLVAAIYALGLVLFSKVNHAIFSEVDSTNHWKITEEIAAAKAVNSNQPLLGIGIVALLAYSTISSCSPWNPKYWDLGLWKPAQKECCQMDSTTCLDSAAVDAPIYQEETMPTIDSTAVDTPVVDSTAVDANSVEYNSEYYTPETSYGE